MTKCGIATICSQWLKVKFVIYNITKINKWTLK